MREVIDVVSLNRVSALGAGLGDKEGCAHDRTLAPSPKAESLVSYINWLAVRE